MVVENNPVQSYHKYLKQKQKKKNLENKILQRECNNLLTTPETLKKQLSELQYKSLFKKLDTQEVKKLSTLECTYEQFLIKSQREQNELNERHTLDEPEIQNSDSSSEYSDDNPIPIIIAGQESNVNSTKNINDADSRENSSREKQSPEKIVTNNADSRQNIPKDARPDNPKAPIVPAIKSNPARGKPHNKRLIGQPTAMPVPINPPNSYNQGLKNMRVGFYGQPAPPPPPPPHPSNPLNMQSNIATNYQYSLPRQPVTPMVQHSASKKAKCQTAMSSVNQAVTNQPCVIRNIPNLMAPMSKNTNINRIFEQAKERQDMDKEFSNFMGEISKL